MDNYKQITKSTYNSIATAVGETYDDYFFSCVKPEADKFLSELDKKSNLLDIGCGIGTHMKYFTESGYSPLGIDISEKMVKICVSRNLNVLEADLENFLFKNNSKFDGIWAHTSLIHFPKGEWKKILQLISDSLVKTGRLFIAVREGSTEDFVDYKDNADLKRWFSNFKIGEIKEYLPKDLELVTERITEYRGRRFINLHLRK